MSIAVSKVSWGDLEESLLISRHDLFNSIRVKEIRNSSLTSQVRLKENTAMLNHDLFFLNVISD